MWPKRKDTNFKPDVTIRNPYYTGDPYTLDKPEFALKRHKKHIEELKSFKLQGNTVVVWSKGGRPWALEVIKALELEAFVDHVLQKPDILYDDEHHKYWFPMLPRWRKDE